MYASFTDNIIPHDTTGIVKTKKNYMNDITIYKYHDRNSKNENALYRYECCVDPECLNCMFALATEKSNNHVEVLDSINYDDYVMPLNTTKMIPSDLDYTEALDLYFYDGTKFDEEDEDFGTNALFDPVQNKEHQEFLMKYLMNMGKVFGTGKDLNADCLNRCLGYGFDDFSSLLCRERLNKMCYNNTGNTYVIVKSYMTQYAIPYVESPYMDGNNAEPYDKLILYIISVFAKIKSGSFHGIYNNIDGTFVADMASKLFEDFSYNSKRVVNGVALWTLRVRGKDHLALRIDMNVESRQTFIYVDRTNEKGPILRKLTLKSSGKNIMVKNSNRKNITETEEP